MGGVVTANEGKATEMSKLEHAIIALQDMQTVARGQADRQLSPVCALVVTVVYLIAMLSVSVDNIGMLLWFAIYPIVAAPFLGMSFGTVFIKSLYTLPFIAFIGIFNPIFDTEPALTVGAMAVTRGWISFMSILLRGLMSVQAIIILVLAFGFEGVCRGMRKLGVPAFLVTQLLMVYRYMSVLLIELLNMRRARESRSYGNARLGLKMWGQMTGQLFLRTVNRSERINRAMLARGFNGAMPFYQLDRVGWRMSDTVFALVWISVFLVLRLVNVSAVLGFDRLF